MSNVLVLGAHGMLGSMVARVLARDPELRVSTAARDRFDVRRDAVGTLLDRDAIDWIVNAVGVTNARIDERVGESIEDAIAVNALFPYRLAAEAAQRGQRVVQIATDGVYSGDRGPYDESAEHDPRDVYGKTKSLGEVPAENVWHLRCSIVGPEPGRPRSLLGWVLGASRGAELTGYDGHRWNGITTLHFARLCAAIIGGAQVPKLQHVVPGDSREQGRTARTGAERLRSERRRGKACPGTGSPGRPDAEHARSGRQPAPVARGRLRAAADYRGHAERAGRYRQRESARRRPLTAVRYFSPLPCPSAT